MPVKRQAAAKAKAPEPRTPIWFEAPPGAPRAPAQQLISAVHVTHAGGHDRVRIWSRGGLAGELVLSEGDGEALALNLGLVRSLQHTH